MDKQKTAGIGKMKLVAHASLIYCFARGFNFN